MNTPHSLNTELKKRRPTGVAIIAIANKPARII